MRIKTYRNIHEFLNSFLKEKNLSQTEFAKSLNYSTSYIDQILKNKKEISEEFISAFSDSYTEFNFNDLLVLLVKEKKDNNGELDWSHKNPTTSEAETPDLVVSLKDTPISENILKMITKEPEILELLEFIDNKPHLQSLVRKLSYYSKEIQAIIEEQVDNYLDSEPLT